jgi:hypothetical protein
VPVSGNRFREARMVPQRSGTQITSGPVAAAADARQAIWRREDGVFVAEELGGLAEQARRRVNRELGWPDAPALLRDLHLRDDGFLRLAAHPRLLARGTALLGAPATIAATALFAGEDIRLPSAFLAAEALIVVPLATRHPARPGAIFLGTRPPETMRHDWPFLIALRRAATPAEAARPVADDALWPDAASVAG